MKGQGEKRLYGVLIALLLFALLLTAVLWDRGRFSVPPTSGWDGERPCRKAAHKMHEKWYTEDAEEGRGTVCHHECAS